MRTLLNRNEPKEDGNHLIFYISADLNNISKPLSA